MHGSRPEIGTNTRAAGGKVDFRAADAADFNAMRPVFESARQREQIAVVICILGRADPADDKQLPAIRAGKVMELFDESIRDNAQTALVPTCLALPDMIADACL